MRLIGAGRPASRAADPGDELTTRLTALAPALGGGPDPEWESRTRARLVAMAAVPAPEPATPVRRRPTPHERRRGVGWTRLTAGLAGTAAAVAALAAVAAAVTLSADARPGDALHGFQLGAGQTQPALAGDARGRTLLGSASTRLEELSVVLLQDPSADLVADTLATMDAETSDGAARLTRYALDIGSGTPLEELAGWTAAQSAGLGEVRSEVPVAAEGAAAHSADLLGRIGERVAALRVALDCPAGPATDGSDALGPVPATCAAPTPPGPAAPTTAPGRTDLPFPDLPIPDLPVPDLPTLFPDPEGSVRPPEPGTAGDSAAGKLPLDVDVCRPDLPVLGDC